ncbi:MAG: hypothetical protein AAB225_28075 [Acidobacteriota bacterium]
MRFATGFFFLFITGFLAGQEPPAGTQQTEPPSPPEYSGPAILSRGGGPLPGGSTELLRLRPYASVTTVYDTGLTGIFTDTQGRLPAGDAVGAQVSFGAIGYHTWKRTELGMTYHGALRHYSRQTYYDGLEQELGLNLTHRVTRRVAITLNEAAASRQRGYYGMAGGQYYSDSFNALAENMLFDTRTFLLSSTARVTFQKSHRLSFSMSGTGALMEPRSRALSGVRSAQAQGDIAYRLSREQTIAGDYSYLHLNYPGAFGSADIHGTAVVYSRQLSRRWELGLAFGGYRVETLRLQRVAIDPVIAAIIGQGTGVEAFHRITYIPRADVRFSYRFRASSLAARYERGLAPGNGLYLTSSSESAGLEYSYTGLRRLHFAASGGNSRYSSLAQTIGRLRTYRAGAGMTYKLSGPLSLVARIDGRRFNIRGAGFERTYYRASVGVAFSPGDVPLALW